MTFHTQIATECSAIDMIAATACANPDAIALRANNSQMTYGRMMSAANALAQALRRLGAGRDVPVGLCLERSFEFVVAMLAVSRAGAAFLPLDPAWPAERLRFVLDDARAPVLVTSSDLAGQFAHDGRHVVTVDLDTAIEADESEPCVQPLANDLAYIIYTSGSTGEPKGVEITQQNLLHLVRWHLEAFDVTAADRASSVAGLGFDAVVWEIWPALAAGASLSLAEDRQRTAPEELRRWLIDERITIAFVPTPLAEALIVSEWKEETPVLRYLLTGGDTLHVRPVRGLPFAVVNNYGPTECTVVATSGTVEHAGEDLPSIGLPIAGATVRILDSQGEPVAKGDTGELYIGGAGVGRGYRHRPKLTAERFIRDSFAHGDEDARLYRTGDLARWLPDGRIAFLGRRDNQVKIRGHRVELDEISAALARHPMVAQSAVVCDAAEAKLVAYIVPNSQASVWAEELREFLSKRLPDYMLPSTYVTLAALPLSASGKLNVLGLPPPSEMNTLASAAYREPSSAVECKVAEIVAEILKLDHVGVEDNFFLLGGHSLLGTQLVLRARDAFGVELSLRDLFQAQTVERLAARIESRAIETVERMSEEEASSLLAS